MKTIFMILTIIMGIILVGCVVLIELSMELKKNPDIKNIGAPPVFEHPLFTIILIVGLWCSYCYFKTKGFGGEDG